MLYLSTRNKTDSYTSYRALHCETAPDGGLFVPFRLHTFTEEKIAELGNMSFGEAVSEILNYFFSAQLTGWDVEFCIGRTPVKTESAGYKAEVAELWHNHTGKYSAIKEILYGRLCGASKLPAGWASVAIDIAVLFGVFTLLSQAGETVVDIALQESDCDTVCAAWYARKMGLPIGKILIVSGENSPVWDCVFHGEFSASARNHETAKALAERLIYDVYGYEETALYLDCVSAKKQYRISEEKLPELNNGLYVSAVGANRADSVKSSVKRSNGYNISRDAAVCFGGLQDYRANTGESKNTLLLSTVKPEI